MHSNPLFYNISATLPSFGFRQANYLKTRNRNPKFCPKLIISGSQVFTVRNTGYQPLNIINMLFSGSQDFSATHNCPPILNVARGCEITVYFAPSVEGPQGAYLWIESNDPDEGFIEVPITGSGSSGECPPEECPGGETPPPGVIPIGGG